MNEETLHLVGLNFDLSSYRTRTIDFVFVNFFLQRTKNTLRKLPGQRLQSPQ